MGPIEADRGVADRRDPGMQLGPESEAVKRAVDGGAGNAVPDPAAVEPGSDGDAPHPILPDGLVELDGGLNAAVAGALRRLEAAHAAIAADGEEIRGEQRVGAILAGQQSLDRTVGPQILAPEKGAAEDGRRGIAVEHAGHRAALGAGAQAFAALDELQIGQHRRVRQAQQIGAVDGEFANRIGRLDGASVQDRRDEMAGIEADSHGDLLLGRIQQRAR